MIPKGITNEKVFQRWARAVPNEGLTWGRYLTGDAFVELGQKFEIFSKDKSILELGTGYGRIFSSLLSHDVPFKSYMGVDLSALNIDFLTKKFGSDKINFKQGEFSKVELDEKFDIVISSAVLKHQYPTFNAALKNIQRFVSKDGVFFFDLRENIVNTSSRTSLEELLKLGPHKSNWEEKTNTFVGFYTKNEAKMILDNLSQKLIAFDHVTHDERMGPRLIVYSTKSE